MSAIQQLQAQRDQIDAEIAEALKAAQAKKKALEEAIARQRAQDIAKGTAEIKAIMTQYQLSLEDVFGQDLPEKHKTKPKGSSYLAEIRQLYGHRM